MKLLVLYLDDFIRVNVFEFLAAATRALIRARLNDSILLDCSHELTIRPAHYHEHAVSRLLMHPNCREPLFKNDVTDITNGIPG